MRILFRLEQEKSCGLSAMEVDCVLGFPSVNSSIANKLEDICRYSPIFRSSSTNLVVIPLNVPSRQEGDMLVRALYETGVLDLTRWDVAVLEEDCDYDDDFDDDDDDEDDDDPDFKIGYVNQSGPYPYQ